MSTPADSPDCVYRTSVKALILDKDKRFLLIQEDNGLWELPGGGLDYGEKPHACLKREIMEEMGIEVASIQQQPCYFVTALNINGQWKSNVIYETTVKSLDFTPTDECVAIRFFTIKEASQESLYPVVKEFLTVYEPGKSSRM